LSQIFIPRSLHIERPEPGDRCSQRLVILDFHVLYCNGRILQQLDVLLSSFELPGRHTCYLIKKKFNKNFFSYNWFIENDCHDLQLKCPIKIDVITMISLRLSRPVAWSPWLHTGSSYTNQKNYYIFLYCYVQTPKVFLYKLKGKKKKRYGRTVFSNCISQVHAQGRVLRVERTFMIPGWVNVSKRRYNTLFYEQCDRQF